MARTDAWREELSRRPDPPALTPMNEVPLLYEAGAEGRFEAVVVITAPPRFRPSARGTTGRARGAPDPEEEKVRRADFSYVNDGSLEELEAFVAGVVSTLSGAVRLLAVSTLLIAVVAAGFVYLRNGEPEWFQRMRYPLEYEQIVRGHARNYELDPALLAAVIYQESKFRADA